MIKSLSLLVRKDGMTREQFVKHWVDIHARPDIPALDVEIDGVAELWYDDRESMLRALTSPAGKALYADGALFIGRIKTFTTEEKEIIPLR
jgi:hypothetical protein